MKYEVNLMIHLSSDTYQNYLIISILYAMQCMVSHNQPESKVPPHYDPCYF